MPCAATQTDFERILAAHGPSILRIARSFTACATDRDDLAQEIALALWQALPNFRGECSEKTFVFRVATNRALDWLSCRKSPTAQSDFDPPDPAPGAEADLVRRELSARLERAVGALPVARRQIVVLALEGLSYREISDVLGISESNVGARFTRAREQLRKLMEEGR